MFTFKIIILVAICLISILFMYKNDGITFKEFVKSVDYVGNKIGKGLLVSLVALVFCGSIVAGIFWFLLGNFAVLALIFG